jgi:glycosyltransferase involved in cell wall biosynthesis
MKVLHVSPSFYPSRAYGGTIRSGYGLCRGLADLGCDVRVLTTDSDGLDGVLEVATDEDEQVDSFRVRYCHKWFRNSISPALIRTLPSYIRWADVVHLTAVYSFPTFPTLFFCRWFGKPIVWSTRGSLQRWEGSSRIVLKWIWESACQKLAPKNKVTLHATSQAEAEQSSKRFPGFRTVVVPNGVDLPENLKRTDSSAKLRLLYLGRLDPIKGVDALLEACAIVGSALDWHLRIAGSGPPAYVTFLKSKVQELGLSERVRFVGEVFGENKEALFAECDVALVPSHVENFAIVVAECLAHALPVIASKGTPWQGLETNHCGLWVDNDPESLAAAICTIRTRPFREMGRQGRKWMERAFSWRSVSCEMLSLYLGCANVSLMSREQVPKKSVS